EKNAPGVNPKATLRTRTDRRRSEPPRRDPDARGRGSWPSTYPRAAQARARTTEKLMSANELSGPVAVLKMPSSNLSLIMFAKSVHDALLGNATFPKPNPTLAAFAADIATYEDAETKAASKTRGAATLRDVKRKKVKDDLNHLRDYVRSIAE